MIEEWPAMYLLAPERLMEGDTVYGRRRPAGSTVLHGEAYEVRRLVERQTSQGTVYVALTDEGRELRFERGTYALVGMSSDWKGRR